MAPAVSVVVCAYADERWDDLAGALESIDRQQRAADEVIVVVDHNPALLERLRAAQPRVTVIPNSGRRGLSGARNSGVAAAGGDVVAFLDDDAAAEPDWLARLLAAYADEEVVAVGGAVLARWSAGRPAAFPEELDWVVGCTYRGLPERTSAVRNVIGANMSFRRSVLDAVGPFREGIGRVGGRPVGCEETELCLRVHRAFPGALVLYEPSAVVRHRVPPERASWRYFRTRCYSEGLSKAIVAQLAGPARGLSSERTYATRTLPAGMARGVRDAVRRRDPAGMARTAALVAGLGLTTAGYVAGTLTGRRAKPSP